MANHSVNSQADPQETERAQDMWNKFTHGVTYATVSILAIVALMAIFLT